MTRRISDSEISTAMTCWARWDFQYGGRLAGDCLRPLTPQRLLSEGRIWGRVVAALHASSDELFPLLNAQLELSRAMAEEIAAVEAADGVVDLDEALEIEVRLGEVLQHYAATAELMPLTRLEERLELPLPSRHDEGRSSSRYRFEGFLDGVTVIDSEEWLVEFKLRDTLQPVWLIELSEQVKRYAWARRRTLGGRGPVGVLVQETLRRPPEPARVLKTGHTSHARNQWTTPELYKRSCAETHTIPHADVLQALSERIWSHTVQVPFLPTELDETGRGLVSAARLIAKLDSGEFWPVRNSARHICSGCRFRRICAHPEDELFVDSLFRRVLPKRDRVPEENVA
jgi:hypothetical protein